MEFRIIEASDAPVAAALACGDFIQSCLETGFEVPSLQTQHRWWKPAFQMEVIRNG